MDGSSGGGNTSSCGMDTGLEMQCIEERAYICGNRMSTTHVLYRYADVITSSLPLLHLTLLHGSRSFHLFLLHMLRRFATSIAISRTLHTMATQLPFTRLVQETQIGILSVLRACYL